MKKGQVPVAGSRRRKKKSREKKINYFIVQCTYVFKKLLALKKKDKYRVFTRTLKRFANAAVSEEDLEQLDQDIQ